MYGYEKKAERNIGILGFAPVRRKLVKGTTTGVRIRDEKELRCDGLLGLHSGRYPLVLSMFGVVGDLEIALDTFIELLILHTAFTLCHIYRTCYHTPLPMPSLLQRFGGSAIYLTPSLAQLPNQRSYTLTSFPTRNRPRPRRHDLAICTHDPEPHSLPLVALSVVV